MTTRPLESGDFVAVTDKHVEYYGYVDEVDWDPRSLRVCVEFLSDYRRWFDLSEVRLVDFPKDPAA